jgi:hypothetical protein
MDRLVAHVPNDSINEFGLAVEDVPIETPPGGLTLTPLSLELPLAGFIILHDEVDRVRRQIARVRLSRRDRLVRR